MSSDQRTKIISSALRLMNNAAEAFTRLNVENISTNGELIRALFLKRSNVEDNDDDRLRMRLPARITSSSYHSRYADGYFA